MSDIVVPVMQRVMRNLIAVLDKAEAHAAARKIDEEVFANARLQKPIDFRASFEAAQFDGLRHRAPQRRRDRQARLSRGVMRRSPRRPED